MSHVPRKFLRLVYWATWFVLVPVVGVSIFIWALAPASGVDRQGPLGWLTEIARDQPVPIAIVTFTVIETLIWTVRRRLPLAVHAYPPLREGLAPAMRGAFEKAQGLLDEAMIIRDKNAKAIRNDVPAAALDALDADLSALEGAMGADPLDERAFAEALTKAEDSIDAHLGSYRKSELREYAESIAIAVTVAMALRVFVVEAFKIPSGSMIPTLQVGDHIFVNKFTYGPAIPFTSVRLWSAMPPERGDVIVFPYPEKPDTDFIKRVIAIPGDTLEARGGHPILNGWEVPSCSAGNYTYTDQQDGTLHDGEAFVEFLGDEAYLTLYDRQALESGYQGPYRVADGEVWVMGDNRNNSHDSRAWFGNRGGGVPFDHIKGRALFVWFSIAERIDWSRMFAPVMGRPPSHGPFPGMDTALKSIEGPIEQCLRTRPPLDKTSPPARGATP